MSICAACGSDNRAGRKFCGRCGAALSTICPACGTANEPDELFCGECGTALVSPASSPPSPETLSVSGEKKQITVLFADVAGSMDLQEQLDAEVWAQIMGRFVSILAEGVRKFGGTVDKFTGDGIMALFGAPVAQEDHARRACHAAWHLTKAIGEYSEELRREQGVELQVRLGLNSGEVVVGRVGDDLTLDPTALGHTVGLAQRMEAMAEPGTAHLTEHTARLVKGWFGLRHLGLKQVKGARDSLPVYVLEGPASAPPVLHGAGLGIAPLVGRERELRVLQEALAMALEGHAQVVGVVGEAGVGKSRLCDEFAEEAMARGITVRRAAGVSHGKDVPLLPILSFQRDYFGITDADSADEARAKITQRMLGLDPDLDQALPLMFDFLEVPDPDRPAPQLAPEARMRRIFDTVRRMTARRSERETLVLIFEDLHWFDPQSEAFLQRLVESYPGSRTLVVTNFRPEFSAPWMRHSYYRQLPLAPLPETAVGELLGGLLGMDFSLAPLLGFVKERTGGNPFFVEEVVRALIEDDTLVGTPGDYQLTRPLHEVAVPASVQAVLADRIDRLPAAQKRILETASVIGRTFETTVLAAVSGSDTEALDNGLSALCAAELLQEAEGRAGVQYRFWHPLTQEVAYGSLLSDRRSRLHYAVAKTLGKLDGGRQEQRAALIASHFERAGDPWEAARWNFRAGAWATRSDLNEAVARWRKTIEQLKKVSPTAEARSLGAWARARLLQVGSRTGISDDDAARLLTEGRALCKGLDDPQPLIAVTRFSTTVKLTHGDLGDALTGLLEVTRVGEATNDAGLSAALWTGPAIAYSWVGPLHEGLQAVDRVFQLSGGDPSRGVEHLGYSPLTIARLSRARMLAQMGRLREAADELEAAVALATERAEPEWQAWALSTYASLADWTGEDMDALPAAMEAVRIAEDLGNLMIRIPAVHAVGLAHLLRGETREAAAVLDAAIEETRKRNAGRFEEGTLLAHRARTHLVDGEVAAAGRAADEAIAVTRAQGVPLLECIAVLTRAQVRRVAGAVRAAVMADLSSALQLVERTQAGVHGPFIREELARVHEDEAELREALRLYGGIGATGHARRLGAELSARSV